MDNYILKIHYWSRPDQDFRHMTLTECLYLIDGLKSNDILSIEIIKEMK